MKAMKKLIAILLCLAMIPCTFLTVFADGNVNEVDATGTVIASKTFDGDNMLSCAASNTTRTPTISTETGHLSFANTGTGWTNFEMAKGVVGEKNDFSIQITFRWKNGVATNGNDTVIFGAYACDYTLKYSGKVQNFDTNNTDISESSEIGKSLKSAWKVPEGEDYGPWVTATLVIAEYTNENDGSKTAGASAFVIEVDEKEFNKTIDYKGSVTNVRNKNKDGNDATPSMELYTGANSQYFEIYDFRVISNGNVLTSKTFDGDNINGCKVSTGTPSISKDTGHLIPASGNWHKIEMVTDTEMNGTKTYSIQQTFRWTYPQESNDSIYFGTYFSDFNINYNGNIQNFSASNGNASVSGEVESAWAVSAEKPYSEWVTATLVIAENKPVKFIVKVGDAECEVAYAANKVTDVTKQNKGGTAQTGTSEYAIYTGGNTQAVEIYDFRVYEGDISGNGNIPSYRTPASTDVIEMYGTQEALDKSAVRFIAELKNTDVDGVTFEVQASRTKDDITTSGKTKIMEPVTVGYTSITETIDGEPQVVRAADGSVFVLFVIRGIDLAAYDEYTFTVSCSASGSFCEEISYTIGN